MLSAAAVEKRTFFDDMRDREFSRLDAQQHAYLDYAGSALYGESQLRAHHAILRAGLFGNPHSDSAPSRASTEIIDAARRMVLRFFDVDETTHDVCFTANTSAAIKLVAEGYAFGPESGCFLAADNHNSVNGIREYARRAGARVRYLPLDAELRLFEPDVVLAEESLHGGGLVAFPAQSNFSGVQHPLDLVTNARALGFDVLLDVAAFVPSHAFSLRRCPADFVALSFTNSSATPLASARSSPGVTPCPACAAPGSPAARCSTPRWPPINISSARATKASKTARRIFSASPRSMPVSLYSTKWGCRA